jgi:hypothetical protein
LFSLFRYVEWADDMRRGAEDLLSKRQQRRAQ